MPQSKNDYAMSAMKPENWPPLLAVLAKAIDVDRLTTEIDALEEMASAMNAELDAVSSQSHNLTPEALAGHREVRQHLAVLAQLRDAAETAQPPQRASEQHFTNDQPSSGLTKATLDRLAQAQNLFVIQDARQFVGNALLFHAQDGRGYTTDLSRAHLFSKSEAYQLSQSRETDIPRQLSDMLSVSSFSVDDQDLQRHLKDQYQQATHTPSQGDT